MGYNKHKKNSGERGNVLFLILIAVALFAALSYAVTQSTRGGGNADQENYKTVSARLMNYVSSVKFAADRMRIINGVDTADIEIASGPGAGLVSACTTGVNCIFAPDGGGLAAQSFSDTELLVFSFYHDTRQNHTIEDIGTNTPTPGTADDVFLRFAITDPEFCQTINKELGLGTTIQADSNALDGVYDAYPGESSACYQEASPATGYSFYHVIAAN